MAPLVAIGAGLFSSERLGKSSHRDFQWIMGTIKGAKTQAR
jgi:hypothetical protein